MPLPLKQSLTHCSAVYNQSFLCANLSKHLSHCFATVGLLARLTLWILIILPAGTLFSLCCQHKLSDKYCLEENYIQQY